MAHWHNPVHTAAQMHTSQCHLQGMLYVSSISYDAEVCHAPVKVINNVGLQRNGILFATTQSQNELPNAQRRPIVNALKWGQRWPHFKTLPALHWHVRYHTTYRRVEYIEGYQRT